MNQLLFLVLISLSSVVFSHSGRTDSSGCHKDNIRGGRHCHNTTPTRPRPTITTTYSWNSGVWSHCTGLCGINQGTKSRDVYCKSSKGVRVGNYLCLASRKPASVTSCTASACKVDIKPPITYTWHSGVWSNCTGLCGIDQGTKNRDVYCKSSEGSRVADSFCLNIKPVLVTSCTANACKVDNINPEDLATPHQDGSVLRGEIPTLSSFFDPMNLKLECVHTAVGFINADLFYADNVLKIKKLEHTQQCDRFSAKYSVLTNLLSIFNINIDNESYRASLELNNADNFNIIYAEKNIDNLETTLKYNRDDWGTSWLDLDDDCQDIRSEVLELFNLEKQNKCIVSSGLWIDPYTQFEFYDASELDIDHIVPLSYAHNHGGANWSPQLKSKFYNDIENLLPVSSSSNRSKGNKAPHEWMPDNINYHCQYVDSFLYIVDKYYLDLSANERSAIDNECKR